MSRDGALRRGTWDAMGNKGTDGEWRSQSVKLSLSLFLQQTQEQLTLIKDAFSDQQRENCLLVQSSVPCILLLLLLLLC